MAYRNIERRQDDWEVWICQWSMVASRYMEQPSRRKRGLVSSGCVG
jgi:hypothetical protein